MIRVVARAALVVGLANLVAELAIFGALFAPRLAAGEPMPWWMWVVMYLPVLAAMVWVARAFTRLVQPIAAGIATGCVAQVEKWALAVWGAAGHDAALASVAPTTFWTVHFARMTFGFVAVYALLYAFGRLVRREA